MNRRRALWVTMVLLAALPGCKRRSAPSSAGGGRSAPTSLVAPLSGRGGPPARPALAPEPGRCTHAGSGKDYPVGPGQKYATLGQVPFESLKAGDTVRVFWRAEPYREKLMIDGLGTEKDPIRVCGVPGPKGELPVIDGENATTRKELDFPYDGHQVRGLVIIGHPHDTLYEATPRHIVLEGLEIRNGSPPFTFTDRSGKVLPYSGIVAGIFVQRAQNVTIRGCTVTANNNGIFIGTGGGVELTQDVLIEGNYIHDNGSLAEYYEHNVYNEASNVTYQYNRFGPPRGGKAGILGANIKERSAGVIIRYNWIEDGAHLLDIVDAQEAMATTQPMPSFHATYVYGNVMIRGKTPSGSMIHYGGDSGVFENYRKGTLFFYDNTLVVKNETYGDYKSTAVFELSTNEEHLDARNNVFYSTIAPADVRPIGMLGARDQVSSGVAVFSHNWVREGWTAHDLTPGSTVQLKAEINGFDASTRGTSPAFHNGPADEYELAAGANFGAAAALEPEIPPALAPTAQYVRHQRSKPRPAEPAVLGALVE